MIYLEFRNLQLGAFLGFGEAVLLKVGEGKAFVVEKGQSELGFYNGGAVLQPGEHIHDEVVPVLETFVDDGGTGLGVVVFVEGAFLLQVVTVEADGLLGEFAGFLLIAVVNESAEHHVVGDAPDGALPVGGVVGGLQVVHLLETGEGADAVGCPEGALVEEVFFHHARCLFGGGDACPEGHEA